MPTAFYKKPETKQYTTEEEFEYHIRRPNGKQIRFRIFDKYITLEAYNSVYDTFLEQEYVTLLKGDKFTLKEIEHAIDLYHEQRGDK